MWRGISSLKTFTLDKLANYCPPTVFEKRVRDDYVNETTSIVHFKRTANNIFRCSIVSINVANIFLTLRRKNQHSGQLQYFSMFSFPFDLSYRWMDIAIIFIVIKAFAFPFQCALSFVCYRLALIPYSFFATRNHGTGTTKETPTIIKKDYSTNNSHNICKR